METTSLAWNYNTPLNFIGCGIDSEKIDRFLDFNKKDKDSFSFIFTEREKRHFNLLKEPAKAYCAAFCCKEAFFKALGSSYNFTDCEFLLDPLKEIQEIHINRKILKKYGIIKVVTVVNYPVSGECLVSVYLLG